MDALLVEEEKILNLYGRFTFWRITNLIAN
jgi:hypothetical protein